MEFNIRKEISKKSLSKEEIEKRAAKIKCTMCGKPFTVWDVTLGDNTYDIFVNYPSNHDLERIQLNLCVDCFDGIIDMIIPLCSLRGVVMIYLSCIISSYL